MICVKLKLKEEILESGQARVWVNISVIKIIWNKIWDARNGLERVKERTSEAISFLSYLNIILDSYCEME